MSWLRDYWSPVLVFGLVVAIVLFVIVRFWPT